MTVKIKSVEYCFCAFHDGQHSFIVFFVKAYLKANGENLLTKTKEELHMHVIVRRYVAKYRMLFESLPLGVGVIRSDVIPGSLPIDGGIFTDDCPGFYGSLDPL